MRFGSWIAYGTRELQGAFISLEGLLFFTKPVVNKSDVRNSVGLLGTIADFSYQRQRLVVIVEGLARITGVHIKVPKTIQHTRLTIDVAGRAFDLKGAIQSLQRF